MQFDPTDARFAVGLAACAGLATTIPLAGARAVPSIVRAGLVLALAPVAASHIQVPSSTSAFEVALAVVAAALGGATLGISASIVAGAAAAAGTLFDVAITAPPTGIDRLSGQNAGPFATLLPLGFALAMFSSGAFTWLAVRCIDVLGSLSVGAHDVTQVVALGRLTYGAAIGLVFPMLCAYGLSSIVAGVAARAAPRINGMLLAPALSSALGLVMALAAVPTIFAGLDGLAQLAARVVRAT